MKIDLIYPKIPEDTNIFLGKCIAFEKYDGTNLHWIWNSTDGWHLFGTRRTQFIMNRIGIEEFTKTHSELANAPHVFNEQFRDKLTMFLCQHDEYRHVNVILFTEFYGPNSFAGGHTEEDAKSDDQDLVIIDVMRNHQLITPSQLIEDFDGFNTAKVIYTGKYNGQFTEDVRKGKYGVNEGVVCKGIVDGEVVMTKVKTKDYLKRLEKR